MGSFSRVYGPLSDTLYTPPRRFTPLPAPVLVTCDQCGGRFAAGTLKAAPDWSGKALEAWRGCPDCFRIRFMRWRRR